MAIQSAGYDQFGNINVARDGKTITVPDDMGNRDRQELEDWVDKGNTIAPYVVPAKTEEQLRVEAFDAAPEAVDLATRARTATNVQIDAWLTANVTTLAQARTVLGAIIKRLVAKGLL